jgi:CRP-like cAMP-binding protein
LLLCKPRNASVIANEPTTAFRIKKEAFDEVLERYPNIRFALNTLVDRRVDDVSRLESLPSTPIVKHLSGNLHDPPESLLNGKP